MKTIGAFLPDGMDERRVVLVKAVKYLRLTNELRWASEFARVTDRELILAIEPHTELSEALTRFVEDCGIVVHRAQEKR